MFEATQIFSRRGLFNNVVSASSISSREDARKLWPFVESKQRQRLVTWVSPSWDDQSSRPTRREHFRRLPPSLRIADGITQAMLRDRGRVRKTRVHELAQRALADECRRRIANSESLPWGFKDQRGSTFPCCGDFLQDASDVHEEYAVISPIDHEYILDVAVSGETPEVDREVIGGIEIEYAHEFTGLRAMLLRCLGFPLISVDVADLDETSINAEWARTVLSATTLDHPQGRRSTFVYVHDMLVPAFTHVPAIIDRKRKQQYIVFASDHDLSVIETHAKNNARIVGYDNREFSIQRLTDRSEQSAQQLRGVGKIVGPDWTQMNAHACLRITLPRADEMPDVRAQRFMRRMARVIVCDCNALVGYQYKNSVYIDDPEADYWVHKYLDQGMWHEVTVLPKRVAEPVRTVMRVVEQIGRESSDDNIEV